MDLVRHLRIYTVYKDVKISLSSPPLPFPISSPLLDFTLLSISRSSLSLHNLTFLAMMKLVVELELHDEKDRQKALKAVSGLLGIESIQIELKSKKLTVIGDVDPVCVVRKLRKLCCTTIVSVGTEKEDAKQDTPKDPVAEFVKAYPAYNPYMTPHYYVARAEEYPNACVIC